MDISIKMIMAFILATVLCMCIMPYIISFAKKLKLKQTILHYVDNHSVKSGTPTFGGVGFIIATVIALLSWNVENNSLSMVCIAVFLGYGIIGFLDDFIKIYFKRNKGLSVYQKIIAQVALSVIVSIYAYKRVDIGTELWIPFFIGKVDIGYFIVPFNALLIVAITNGVNLIDGLDGLASKVSIVFLVGWVIIIAVLLYFSDSIVQVMVEEYHNLLMFAIALIGGLVGFLCFNGYPAKVFMGDTGALAIGGAIACLTIFTKTGLFLPLLGIAYTITCLSVVLQVAYYKMTKKRIFLMAPLHHHFEKKGVHENTITIWYTAVSIIMTSIIVALCIYFVMKK